jgi:hypothetical protein
MTDSFHSSDNSSLFQLELITLFISERIVLPPPLISSAGIPSILLHFVQITQRTRLWGYVKNRVFVPPLPRDLAVLKARIIAAVNNIDAPILTRVWQELEYRIDVCRVTRGAHIEHL